MHNTVLWGGVRVLHGVCNLKVPWLVLVWPVGHVALVKLDSPELDKKVIREEGKCVLREEKLREEAE